METGNETKIRRIKNNLTIRLNYLVNCFVDYEQWINFDRTI